uniref:Ribosomal protein L34 n=1 Tax=Apophlaea sinclairii TaxID=212746 RepID=A0A1C9CBQ2_9FLOR|nr:ribosomal protein L34 [Apophlaea sinclairii]AOM65806.1 ribosomal protein L34 [Apophlaea sinclairii]
MTKRTLQGTKRKKISYTGFRARIQTTSGKQIIKQRRKKRKKKLIYL